MNPEHEIKLADGSNVVVKSEADDAYLTVEMHDGTTNPLTSFRENFYFCATADASYDITNVATNCPNTT